MNKPQITVINVKGAVVIAGHDTVCYEINNLYRALDLLENAIQRSDQLLDLEKLKYQAEIKIIKGQMARSHPQKRILRTAWDKLKPLATVLGIIGFFETVKTLIEPLLR
jgi:hypothetical protein